MKIRWLESPEDHDYPAALSYLSLVLSPHVSADHIRKLRNVEVVQYRAKDLVRASGARLLDMYNEHVRNNVKKIFADEYLSPLLLVRHEPLIIADGYHRLCAVYLLDEDAWIPCKLV